MCECRAFTQVVDPGMLRSVPVKSMDTPYLDAEVRLNRAVFHIGRIRQITRFIVTCCQWSQSVPFLHLFNLTIK